MRPAMIVVGLAALILVVFVTIGTGHPRRPGADRYLEEYRGRVGLLASCRPRRPALTAIARSGEPPSNIINAVSVPEGSTRVSHQNNSGSAGQFDAQVGLLSDASQGALLTFFLRDMKAQGWQVFKGPARPATTPVPSRSWASWRAPTATSGRWVRRSRPTTFGAGAPPAGETDFTVRLFQVPDPD